MILGITTIDVKCPGNGKTIPKGTVVRWSDRFRSWVAVKDPIGWDDAARFPFVPERAVEVKR